MFRAQLLFSLLFYSAVSFRNHWSHKSIPDPHIPHPAILLVKKPRLRTRQTLNFNQW